MRQPQTLQSWFTSMNLIDYYNQTFGFATSGQFKIPRAVLSKFLDDGETDPKTILSTACDAIGEIAIQSIINTPPARILQRIPFRWLELDTQEMLRQSVCEFIKNASLNNQFWERLNASNLTTPSFTLNTDVTGWLLQSDNIGIDCKNLITASGIGNYEIIEQDALWQTTKNGNMYVVGSISELVAKELTL